MVDLLGKPAPSAAQTDADLPSDGTQEHGDASPSYASTLERVLSLVDERSADPTTEQERASQPETPRGFSAQSGAPLRVGFVHPRRGRMAQVSTLGGDSEEWVAIAPHVDCDLIDRALSNRALALLAELNHQIHIIGLVQTSLAEQTLITGKTIVVEASEQLTLRSGRAAIALRSDGALEMVGTRIAATSRGVFRLIGRALRLN